MNHTVSFGISSDSSTAEGIFKRAFMADTMTTRDDLISTLQADEKEPDEAFVEFLLKLDSWYLEFTTMLV